MDTAYIKDLKAKVDLQNVFGYGKTQCPWHEDAEPSLMIYPTHVHCFACWHTTDGIGLLRKLNPGWSFSDAVRHLEQFRGLTTVQLEVELPPLSIESVREKARALQESAVGLAYLEGRGIYKATAWALQLGWDGERIAIPFFVNGEVENEKFRRIDDRKPKYMNHKHRAFTKPWPWDYFRRYHYYRKVMFVTEGEFDAALLLARGFPALSVPSGVNMDLREWVSFFKRFALIVVLYDLDKAGDTAVYKLYEGSDSFVNVVLPTQVVRYTWDPSWGKDVTDAREQLLPVLKTLYHQAEKEAENGTL
jgi:DNA primase